MYVCDAMCECWCELWAIVSCVGWLGVCANKPRGVCWVMMFVNYILCLCVCLPRCIMEDFDYVAGQCTLEDVYHNISMEYVLFTIWILDDTFQSDTTWWSLMITAGLKFYTLMTVVQLVSSQTSDVTTVIYVSPGLHLLIYHTSDGFQFVSHR